MAWLLVAVTGVLAALVVVLALLAIGLRRRLADLERRLEAPAPASREAVTSEYVITRVGEREERPEPVPTVPAPVFADLVLKETVVQTASLVQGLRRALAPETRNRIRFHVRQEVKRSRKQRRAELREVRREWAARQRAAVPADAAGESAA